MTYTPYTELGPRETGWIAVADINNPRTSMVRAKVQRAPRREGFPTYPGAAWKTVKGMTGLMADAAGKLVAELRENDPDNLYKVVTYNIR